MYVVLFQLLASIWARTMCIWCFPTTDVKWGKNFVYRVLSNYWRQMEQELCVYVYMVHSNYWRHEGQELCVYGSFQLLASYEARTMCIWCLSDYWRQWGKNCVSGAFPNYWPQMAQELCICSFNSKNFSLALSDLQLTVSLISS